MTEKADDTTATHRPLLPEEAAAGSDDPQRESEIILEDSERRTEQPEQTKRESVQTPD